MTIDNKSNIKLRAIEPEDLDFLYSIENDMDLWNVSTTNVPYSRYLLYDYVANTKNDIYADRQVRMIIENTSNEIIGLLDLINFDPRHMRAEVGIVLQKKYRNKGYAHAALQKTQKYATEILHLRQLYAIIPSCNKISLKLFEGCGFTNTAVLKEWLFNGTNYINANVMQFFMQKTE